MVCSGILLVLGFSAHFSIALLSFAVAVFGCRAGERKKTAPTLPETPQSAPMTASPSVNAPSPSPSRSKSGDEEPRSPVDQHSPKKQSSTGSALSGAAQSGHNEVKSDDTDLTSLNMQNIMAQTKAEVNLKAKNPAGQNRSAFLDPKEAEASGSQYAAPKPLNCARQA